MPRTRWQVTVAVLAIELEAPQVRGAWVPRVGWHRTGGPHESVSDVGHSGMRENPGVGGEFAADDPALLEGDDGGRVGGVAFGEGPGEMRDRVEQPDGVHVQRRAGVAEPASALSFLLTPVTVIVRT